MIFFEKRSVSSSTVLFHEVANGINLPSTLLFRKISKSMLEFNPKQVMF